jgi:hypothetical protein
MIDDNNPNEFKNDYSIVDNSYRDNNERNNRSSFSRFRTLFFKKDKEYNNLLDEYNAIVVKFNKMKGQLDQLLKDKNNKINNSLKKTSRSDNNLIKVDEPISEHFSNTNNDEKNTLHQFSDLMIEQNNDITIINDERRFRDKNIIDNNNYNIDPNKKRNEFNLEDLYTEINDQFLLNYEFKKFNENKFNISEENKITINPEMNIS